MNAGSAQPAPRQGSQARTRAGLRLSPARVRDTVTGWLFIAPAVLLLLVFLVIPILLAAWVSVSNWTGIGSPLGSTVHSVGFANYAALLTENGLSRQNLGESLRNNLYYVIFVVPTQTALSLILALAVTRKRLVGHSFFRTAFYFPSVTSSVAISIVFLFLFSGSGVINSLLLAIGIHGPNWFTTPQGIIHLLLGAFGLHSGPGILANHGFLGVSFWDWLAGPSVAMVAIICLAIWTTSGTFMLMFMPALLSLSGEVDEAASIDGANSWQRFWLIKLPLLRPTLIMVLTLGMIGTWQVFDQIFLISQGNPLGTTLTPAYLAYSTSFGNQEWGQGAAIAFILFFIIIGMTLLQRLILRNDPLAPTRQRHHRRSPAGLAG